jgi:transcriptional antiterminator RfaH
MSFLSAGQTSSGPRWYVVQTRHLAETRAAQELTNQGFEVFLPRYLKKRRHARKVSTVAAALFPTYLFVAIDCAEQRWRSINGTIGVVRLIAGEDGPLQVASRVVDALRARLDHRGFIEMSQRPAFASGDAVRIRAGSFAETLGLFEGMTDNERVTILLDLLGRKVRVTLDAEIVAAA